MIKINDRFSIERDSNCWTLYETMKPNLNPFTGEMGQPQIRERYYSQLSHMVDAIVDLAPVGATSLIEISRSMKQIRADIDAALRVGGFE
jgi:hypothetical protein